MANALENRLTRLEQSLPALNDPPEIVVETYLLKPAQPECGSFENHYQHGVKIYDGFQELLNEISGKTRSL